MVEMKGNSETGASPLALRVLADCDQRRRLREILEGHVPAPGQPQLRLATAEACLECARFDGAGLLQGVDAERCAPLKPEVARLWKRWLALELLWWETARTPAPEALHELLAVGKPPEDPYSEEEWHRLHRRVLSLAARAALARGHHGEARQRLGGLPDSWERRYLSGLLAWSEGHLRDAREHLERSLEANPLQSRVRFELSALPGASPDERDEALLPHDALALSAWSLLRDGRTDEAAERLDRLAQEEVPYSLRLIWPRARSLRLGRAEELRAHLAEGRRDWPEALRLWDTVRRGSRDPAHRSHRLYLLGRVLEEGPSAGRPALQEELHKELGKLSIRPLTGDAMFYRALAAAATMPERARSDWRALVRQRGWREQSDAPRLLVLGDRLWRCGELLDAHQVYCSAGENDRRLLSGLAVDAPTTSPAEVVTAFHGLVRHLALPERRRRQGELLLRLVESTDAVSEPDPETLADLPAGLLAAMEILGRSRGTASLRAFEAAFGHGWQEACPRAPQEVLDRRLRELCEQRDYAAARSEADAAAQMGLAVPWTWQVFLWAAEALERARGGDFDAAERCSARGFAVLEGKDGYDDL